jgi:filamentous hemagglutinin
MTKAINTIPQPMVFNARSFIACVVSCTLILQPLSALAQVAAAPGAPTANKPLVTAAANGVPVVQIVTPNAAGVSMNQYSSYNVSNQGLILNNAQSTALTQQGGYVAANPYLAAGSARIIVNQVVGGSSSQLQGYTEVAGAQAEVIIANPAGIYCNGCGFINTSRGVLTTGTPVFGGSGSLDAFHVTGGQIQIGAAGLNGSNVDQVDLIARSVQVNGKLWANQQLNVVTGANDVSHADLRTHALVPDTNVPGVAIDVAQLGGMYANKIMLVGTEAGVGVNSLGTIAAQAGDFTLNSQGLVSLGGSTSASGNAQINSTGDIANTGSLYAGQNATIAAQGQVSNSGTLAALGNLTVNGATVNSSGTLGAGIDTGGNATGNGNLNVNGTGAVTASGQNLAGGNVAFNGSSLHLAGAHTTATGTVALTATGAGSDSGDIDHTGAVLNAGGATTLTATGAVINNQGQLNAGQLTLNAASLSNHGGGLTQTGTAATAITVTNGFDNTAGVLTSNAQDMTLQTGSLINQGGQINHAGTGLLTLGTGVLTNDSGTIITNGQAAITAASLSNTAGSIRSVGALGLTTAGDIVNSGTISAGGAATLTAANISNNAGNIVSLNTDGLSLSASGQLTNTAGGAITGYGNTTIQAANINNAGTIAAGALISTNSTTLNNTGTIVGAQGSLVATQSITNLGPTAFIGATDAAGKLELLAPDIENRDDTTATDTQAQTAIYGLGQVVLAGGKDVNGNYIDATLIKNQSALIQSGGDMLMQSALVTNTRRTLTTSPAFTGSVDSTLLTKAGISLSGTVGDIDVHDPNSIGGVYIEPPHGGALNSDYLYTTYSADSVASNQLVTISPQAQIISGGNIAATSVGTLQNYWSQIAAVGNISAPGILDQNSWHGQTPLQVQVVYSGTYLYRTYDNKLWTMSFCSSGCDTGADVRTYALPSYDSSFTAGGALSGNGVTINNVAGNASLPQLGTSRASAPSVINNITLPQGGLFKTNTAPGATYLIETNPAFTDLHQWLSSDFYFQQMGVNPSQIQERLGDGYYEQQLVQNQVLSLTGKAVLSNYASTQDEFQAMMTSGAALAQSLNLALGMSLSAAQVAQLTSDVVIMQDQVVDGKTVLVPVVYLAQTSQQNSNGPLIAAGTIDLTNTQGFTNSGTVAATGALTVTGQSIDNQNGALQSGGLMSLATTGDVNLTSANVTAGSLQLAAGGNLILDTETKTTNQVNDNGATRTTTTLGPVANLAVMGDAQITTGGNIEQNAGNLTVGGNLAANVGGSWEIGTQQTGETQNVARYGGVSDTSTNQVVGSSVFVGGTSNINVSKDLIASGAQIDLLGGGSIAANNVELLASKTTSTVNSTSAGSSGNHSYSENIQTSNDVVNGTTLQSGQSLSVTARTGDITLSGSTIQVALGATTLTATGDVNIVAAMEDHSSNLDETHGYTALGSGKQTSNHVASQAEFSYGSTISADAVTINSGKDLTINGSNVIGTNDVTLAAAGKVTINTSQDTQSSQTDSHTHEFGMLSGSDLVNTLDGGLKGVSVGTRSTTDGQQSTQVINNASMVGSVDGNLTVTAGDALHVTGSTVYAGNDATFTGKSVSFDSAFNTMTQSQQQSTSQTAVSGGLTSPIITAIQTVQAMEKASKDTDDPRLQAMAAATSAMAIANAYSAISNAALGSAVGVSISLGTSQSNNQSTSTLSQAVGSSASAGNNLSVIATGAGANSNIDVIGSSLSATNNTTIAADGTVNLLAAKNTTTQQNTNDGASASIGVTFGIGASNGISFQLGVSANKGDGTGNDVVYTNTQVSGGNKVSLTSGSDTNLIGAVVTAPQVVASVGGNLDIQSLQDTSTFDSKQTSAGIGVSLCIPPICYGSSSVSGNFSNANVNGDYASVTTQSGIQTGDQGFQIAVAGNTNLTGAVIESSNQAVADNKNTLTTGTLTQGTLQNTDTFDASGFSIAGSVSGKVGNQSTAAPGAQQKAAGAKSTPSGSSGFSSDSGSQASITKTGISGGAVTITNDAAQTAATGQTGNQTIASLNRDVSTGVDTSSALSKAWNGDQLMQKTQAAIQISAAFGSTAAKVVGDYAQQQYDQASTPEEKAEWAEGGAYRVALHTAMGVLGGGLDGALGAAATASIMPIIGDMIDKMDLPDPVKQAVGMVTATTIGAISGGSAGAAAAFNADVNNRQLHDSEKVLAISLASASNGKYTAEQIEMEMRGMTMKENGVTEPGTPTTVIGSVPDVGGPWARVGTTTDGQPIYSQEIGPEDAALRAYIVQYTNHNEVPSLITYAEPSSVPVYSSVSPTTPTATCAVTAADCAAGIAPSLSSAQIQQRNTQLADFFSQTSTNYTRAASVATAAGQPEVAVPFEAASAILNLLEQAARPDVGQVLIDSVALDLVTKRVSEQFNIPLPVAVEAADRYVKPQLQSARDWINQKTMK